MGAVEGGTGKRCGSCGSALAPDASFCRYCGTRYEAPPRGPDSAHHDRGGSHRTALWAGVAIVMLGAGAALAILLAGGSSDAGTTVVVSKNGTTSVVTGAAAGSGNETERSRSTAEAGAAAKPVAAAAPEAVAAGHYVQAGTFRTVEHAEIERERLAAGGVEVTVIPSNGAAEFYPNLQVLVAGPIANAAEERSLIAALRHDGVPDAFGRDLSPAPRLSGPSDAAGRWGGTLDRTSGEHPDLEATLPVTVEIESDGRTGRLVQGGCTGDLTLSEAGPTSLTYKQEPPCVSGGLVGIRPSQGELMVELAPLGSDVLALGTLSPG